MLSLTLTVCLAAATSAAPPPAPADGPVTVDDLITRRYDLSAVTGTLASPPVNRLLPLPLSANLDIPLDMDDVDELLEVDALIDLITETIDPDEWEAPRRAVEEVDNTLVVSATASTHAKITALLAGLARLLDTPYHVRVALFASGIEQDPAPIMDRRSAQTWLDSGLRDGTLAEQATLSIDVPPQAWVSRSLGDRIRYVADWDVEIAQGAAVGDPVTRILDLGPRLALSASRTTSGTRLTLALTHAQLDGPMRERRLEGAARLKSQNGMHEPIALGTVQLPSVRFASIATSFDLAENQVALVQIAIGDESLSLPLLAAIEVTGGPPLFSNLAGSNGFDIGAFSEVVQELASGEEDSDWLALEEVTLLSGDPRGASWWTGTIVHERRDVDALFETIADRLGEDTALYRLGRLALFPAADQDHVRRILETWDAPRHPDCALEITVTASPAARSQRPERESWPAARLVMPMHAGAEAHVYFGRQQARIIDWDVDVANESSVANPVVANPVSGGFVRARVAPAAGGDMLVDLSSVLILADDDPTGPFDLGQKIVGRVDLPRAWSGSVSGRRLLRMDESGRSKPVSLGTILVRDGISYDLEARLAATW